MSVQQIIAQLNNNEKITPPSPVPSPTTTIIKGCSATEKDNNNNFASLLDKFGQQQQRQQRQTSATFLPEQAIPSYVRSKSPTATSIQKSAAVTAAAATSPQTAQQQQWPTRSHSNSTSLSAIDTISNDLLELIQELVDRNKEAEQYIEALQSKVDEYASDVTKVRDYQIRVEYLASKLEQVSEERDYFENELLKNQTSQEHQAVELNKANRDITTQDLAGCKPNSKQHYSLNDFLGIYERLRPNDMDSLDHEDNNSNGNESDELQIFDTDEDGLVQTLSKEEKAEERGNCEEISSQMQQQEEISILNDQLVQCDKGLQMTLMTYVTDLEKQRLETKCLKEVIKKQDELITKLERKLSTGGGVSDDLLKEQVDLQKIELENKRELLSQLLSEREELLQRLNKKDSGTFLREPMMPAQIVRVATPPLTAPPKQPLPPLPKHCQAS